jgi:phenylacetic acid degradation protein
MAVPCYAFEGLTPVVSPAAYVHPTAVLIGDVVVGARCYVGPLASLRGDMGRITVGEGSNIQDNCVLHTFPGADLVVEEDGHIGHGAILHGCRIGPNALIGMNAVLMDGAVIGRDCFVGSLSFVKAKFEAPPRSLVMGSPARIVRELSDQEIDWKATGTRLYQHIAERSAATMTLCEPLQAEEPGRRRLETGMLPLADHRAQD